MEKKNGTKLYLLILWTITLIVVVLALFYHVFKFNVEIFHIGKASAPGPMQEIYYKADVIDSIDIETDAADVDIVYGKELKIEHNYPEDYAPTIKVRDGKLSVTQHIDKISLGDISDYKLNITVPDNTDLNSVKIDTDAGDIDLKGLNIQSLQIEADAGDINLKDLNTKDVNVSTNAGDIDLESSEFDYISINTDLGDIELSDTDFYRGEITADCGNISVDGDFERLKVKCDLGDISVNVPDPETKDLDLDCDLGSVKVNGKKWN
ncbi:MAG: DUF4097 family beta strand repeat protein [Lachnospiraceae bacterium]|nr:DUF4097 family beta strand repeat protein [Lachnospiraceae bacterium]